MLTNARHFTPLLAAILLASAPASALASVVFSLNDNNGAPASGTYTAGQTFTLTVTLQVTNNTPSTLTAYSLWFDTATATASLFSITTSSLATAASGNPFTAGQPGVGTMQTFTQANPTRAGFLSNVDDLGAGTPNGTAVAAGNYLVENITFLIAGNTPQGTYTIRTTPLGTGGSATANAQRASGAFDANFDTTYAASSTYTITVVPEPGTWAMMVVGAMALAGSRRLLRRRA